jgi:hypothetical protein
MAQQDSREEDPYRHLDLRRARLCLDCESIFEGPQCPACTSETFVPLTRWIRPTERAAVERRPEPALPAPTPAKSRRLLRKTLYVGLGAYGVWKMLFEPAKPRKRKPPKPPAEPEA